MNWINVNDRLPEYQDFCLLIEITQFEFDSESQTICLGWLESKKNIKFNDDMWFIDGSGKWVNKNRITHWMKLPKLPKP